MNPERRRATPDLVKLAQGLARIIAEKSGIPPSELPPILTLQQSVHTGEVFAAVSGGVRGPKGLHWFRLSIDPLTGRLIPPRYVPIEDLAGYGNVVCAEPQASSSAGSAQGGRFEMATVALGPRSGKPTGTPVPMCHRCRVRIPRSSPNTVVLTE